MIPQNSVDFHSIKGLFPPEDGNQSELAAAANSYVLRLPQLAGDLLESLFAGENPRFIADLCATQELLNQVYARWPAAFAAYLLAAAQRQHTEFCQKQISAFLATLYGLSVDIQLAQAGQNRCHAAKDSLEWAAELLNQLIIIERLLTEEEGEPLYQLLSCLAKQEQDAKLKAAAAAKDKTLCLQLCGRLKEHCQGIIDGHFARQSAAPLKILAVDDRPEILTAVSQALKGLYKVMGAPSCHMALKILEKEQPALFLLDIAMPEMNGYQLLEEIRSRQRFYDTPAIFLSGNITKDDLQKALAAGAQDFLVKPVNSYLLIARLSRYLS